MFSDNDTHERKFPNKDVEWVGELPRSDGFYTLLASSSNTNKSQGLFLL